MPNRGYNQYDKDDNYVGRMEPIPEPPKKSWGGSSGIGIDSSDFSSIGGKIIAAIVIWISVATLLFITCDIVKCAKDTYDKCKTAPGSGIPRLLHNKGF
ncbi:MAG: hypothetical protein AAB911_00540 [Patescibacteria group bacterium]